MHTVKQDLDHWKSLFIIWIQMTHPMPETMPCSTTPSILLRLSATSAGRKNKENYIVGRN